MKLLSITNRYYFISITLFFVLAGAVLYFSIKHNLKEELDEQLRTEQGKIINAMSLLDSVNYGSLLFNDNLSFELTSPLNYQKPFLRDSMFFDSAQNEYIPYRLIQFSAKTKMANYIVTIKSSEIENEDIIYSVFIGLMLVFGLFSIMLLVSNYYFSKKLWSPFLNTISVIKTLKFNNKERHHNFETTNIDEFKELNLTLQQMIERLQSEYLKMKDFSENASHELQTPLTIIRSKLESLLQSEDLTADNAQLINQALENTVRLSRINQTLLMLTKIENRQFEEKETIHFSQIFNKYLELYDDIIKEKKIIVSKHDEKDFIYNIHPVLADVLISNLLGNAIKHNVENGNISINIKNNGFEINNTGLPPENPPELLFTRFKKGNHSPENLGLGLALVKEITEINDLSINYEYFINSHRIKVNILSR